MIYITITENTQEVYVPRNGFAPAEGEGVKFQAVSTSDHIRVDFFIHEATVDGQYLKLVAGLPEELFTGEWEYQLILGQETVSTGILQVTEEAEAPAEYNKEITYKQYGE